MTFHISNGVQRTIAGQQYEIFNSPVAAASDPIVTPLAYKAFQVYKPDQVAALSMYIQGSMDGIHWVNISSEITGSIAVTDSFPWKYVRVNAGTVTPTERTAAILTQEGGVATFSCNDHGFDLHDWLTISGAEVAGFNGVVQTTLVSAGGFQYAVDAATASPETGAVTIAVAHVQVWVGY